MRYLPVTLKDRSHVGKNWNRYYLRSFQIMLQATHGVVSGSTDFFLRAFGSNEEQFEHGFSHYHTLSFSSGTFTNTEKAHRFSTSTLPCCSVRRKHNVLNFIDLLSVTLLARPRRQAFLRLLCDKSTDQLIRELARFHAIDTKDGKGH